MMQCFQFGNGRFFKNSAYWESGFISRRMSKWNAPKYVLFISCSSCNLVLFWFSGQKIPPMFPFFCKMLLGCRIFSLLYFFLGRPCHELVCWFSCRKLFRTRKAFLNFGFKNLFVVFACYFGFWVNLKTR